MFRNLRIFLAALVLVGAATRVAQADVTVAAAISLQKVLEGARADLEKAAGDKVAFTFGASGTLAGQVRAGAPIDLFISADRANIDKLVGTNNVDKGTITVVATNQLWLIRSKKGPAIANIADLTKAEIKHVAIGEPKVVPAGEYARQSLVAMKLWEPLQAKLVTAENVAQVMALVDRGEVDAGFVYRTDAAASQNAELVAAVDPSLHAPIEYVSAQVTGAKNGAAAAKLQQAFASKEFLAALAKAGFSIPADSPATKPAAAQGGQ